MPVRIRKPPKKVYVLVNSFGLASTAYNTRREAMEEAANYVGTASDPNDGAFHVHTYELVARRMKP